MPRVSLSEATQQEEKRAYFQSEYSLNKVAGNLDVGREVCVIPIGLEQGVYKTRIHNVRAKGEKNGFKGWYNTKIACKSQEGEECLCCELAKAEKEKFPDKNDSSRRLITGASTAVHLPLMVLSAKDAEKLNGKQPVELLQMDSVAFSYLDLANSTWDTEIIGGLRTKLEEDGLINYEMTEEEAKAVVNKYICNTIIKIKCVPSKTKGISYQREYTFIPFYSKKIGSKFDTRNQIIHYRKNTELMNLLNDFLTLFDVKEAELTKDWTNEELEQYIVKSEERKENIKTAIKVDAEQTAPPKEEQTVTIKTEEPATEEVEKTATVEDEFEFEFDAPSIASAKTEEPAIEIADEDTSFDLDDDDSFFDDTDGID